MAGKKENVKALFSNTRSRVIIVFTALILVITVGIGLIKFLGGQNSGTNISDVRNPPPGIQSIPGSSDPTAQYAKLQESQNVNQAQSALKTGGSAIPTIIRSQAIGNGVQGIGEQSGQGGLSFSGLLKEDDNGLQKSNWIQELQTNSCSKATVTKVVSEGAQLSDLKEACNCIQLKDDGYQLANLQPVCSCKELKAAGFNARQLKDAGFTAKRLRDCGFDACELRNAGFSAQEMKDGGFSDGELKGAGFSDAEIARTSGLPNGVTEADIKKAGCDPQALAKLRAAGVSAGAIRRIDGCSAEQLKAAGYTAQELRDAGFTAADLKKAGFTAAQLRQAGFSARDLLNAGFTPADLANAGYSPAQILAAESELPPGVSPDDVRAAGCDETVLKKERLAGVSAKSIRQYAGCSLDALRAAGFTDDDLANAGFTPQEIAGISPTSDAGIRASGCDPEKLKVLFKAGVTAKRIHDLNGCSAAQLKAAGYDAKSLLNAGFTPAELAAAGFNSADLQTGQDTSDDAIRAAGCDSAKLKKLFNAGVSAKRIHDLNGCTAAQLKAAGYDAKSLLAAGFTPADLLAAGFTPQELQKAGVNPADIIAAGRDGNCSVEYLKSARALGVSATTIRETLGCSAAAMKAAGYTAAELKAAGFTAAELKNAGFTAAELKAAGFSAKELKDAGFSAADLKNAGFTAAELKDAGFSAADLKAAGFTAAELKAAGFSAKELKDAGFSAADLKAAGFSAKELQEAGFSADDLKKAGFSAADLAAIGINNSQLAGLDAVNPPASTSNMPSVPGYQPPKAAAVDTSAQQLQAIMQKQNAQMADQKYQQKIQQRTSDMTSAASQAMQLWKRAPSQAYTAGSGDEDKKKAGTSSDELMSTSGKSSTMISAKSSDTSGAAKRIVVKTGDILFAVIDTSINSDEPGPILATIVTGKLKGTKLIGSFNLPSNANKMIITFNTMSIPGFDKTVPINAYAIDPDTARTALSSNTNHHYLLRYGSLFASSFLEGIGGAYQSADTSVTVGGTGGGDTVTVQNGVGRSTLQNAIIALGDVGKAWGQAAQQLFSTPTTVEVYAGTGVGVLFTQDLSV